MAVHTNENELVSLHIVRKYDKNYGDHIWIKAVKNVEAERLRVQFNISVAKEKVFNQHYQISLGFAQSEGFLKIPFSQKGRYTVGFGAHVYEKIEGEKKAQRIDNFQGCEYINVSEINGAAGLITSRQKLPKETKKRDFLFNPFDID